MQRLSPDYVIQIMESGQSQADIARSFGVSRQYVNKLAKLGGHDPVVTRITENFPWHVEPEFYSNTMYQALRLIAHYNYAGEGSLTGSSKGKARAMLKKLTAFRQVVDYDPSYPAIPGISNTPGFAYIPRTDQDEDFIVKIRPGTKITPEGERIWRLPEVLP